MKAPWTRWLEKREAARRERQREIDREMARLSREDPATVRALLRGGTIRA